MPDIEPSKDVQPDSNEDLELNSQEPEENDAPESEDSQEPEGGERLLRESKKWKERARKAEQELEKRRKREAQAQKKYEELYRESESKLEEMQRRQMQKDIRFAVARKGSELGLIDVDDLMAVAKADMLEYDPETGEVEGVESYLNEARKKKPYLFKSKPATGINPTAPRSGKQGSTKLSEVGKLGDREYRNLLASKLKG
jgi:hypothetical protein